MGLYRGYSRHYYVPDSKDVQEIHPLSVIVILGAFTVCMSWVILKGFGVL